MPVRSALLTFAMLALPAGLAAQSTEKAAPDSAARTTTKGAGKPVSAEAAGSVAERGAREAAELVIEREVFSYRTDGRRDPYESLMTSGELRPLPSDLRLTAVAFDPRGRNSVAVLRNVATAEQYRVRVGQSLGRLRIAGIRPKAVVFSISEFGFSRQETLPLSSDSTSTRTR